MSTFGESAAWGGSDSVPEPEGDDRPALVSYSEEDTDPVSVTIQEEQSAGAWIRISSEDTIPARWVDHEPEEPAPGAGAFEDAVDFESEGWFNVREDGKPYSFIRSTLSVEVRR